MYKYIGDSILNASFTVLVPKPLDNRTVVNNLQELYSIPAAYAYVGMTVANIDNGNIYMLVDKSKIYEKSGWRASYESIQIISCTYSEYEEWLTNTDENFQPIDDSLSYIHRDTYYYIYEDSLPEDEANKEYVKRADWQELLDQITDNREDIGEMIANIRRDYTTLTYSNSTFAALTMFDTEDPQSFISELISNYYTKTESDNKYVTIESLQEEGAFIFITTTRYAEDLDKLEQYKSSISDQLSTFVVTDSEASLTSLIVGQIKSPVAGGRQLVIDVSADGLSSNGIPYAFTTDIPNLITVTKALYEALVANNELIADAYYYITGEEDSYVLRSELELNYYNRNGVKGLVENWSYSKAALDEIVQNLETGITENYFNKQDILNNYVDNNALTQALTSYVTIAMIKNNDDYIFVRKTDYQQGQEDLKSLLRSTYIQKDSDASLNSLETATIRNGINTLTITNLLTLNDKKMAFEDDIPVIQVISQEEFDELEKDPNVFYFVYNTNENLAFVTAAELDSYYTKSQIDSKFASIRQYVDFLNSDILVVLTLKSNLEKILMERIKDNEYYEARVKGQHIDIVEYQPNTSVLTTVGTGLISFIRHMITNDTELGNDVVTVTLTHENTQVVMSESGTPTDTHSKVSIQMLEFLRGITGITDGDIKQSNLANKVITMRIAINTIYVDYSIHVKLAN